MRHLIVVVMAALAGCAMQSRFGGTVTDAPDTSHTNSGSATFGKDGKLHIKPAYVVDTMTPEQHAAARSAHDAYFAKINAKKKAALDAMTPVQRHNYICTSLEEDMNTAAGLPPVSEADQTFTDPLAIYLSEGCE